MSKRGGQWTGIDLSSRMLDTAKEKSYRIRWIKADASHLPIQDKKLKGVLCTLAIHHFNDLGSVFLKSGEFCLKESSPFLHPFWDPKHDPYETPPKIRKTTL